MSHRSAGRRPVWWPGRGAGRRPERWAGWHPGRRARLGRPAWLAVLTVLASGMVLALAQIPASGLNASGTSAPVTGNATWFSGLGSPYGGCGLYPDHWNNRQVSWQFIAAPGYTGDISIGAIQGAQPYWPAIAISHLRSGIHGVQFLANGTWVNAQMDADMGDDYIIGPTTGAGTNGSQYQIRVIDASGNLVNSGETYSFTLPAGCSNGCSAPYTPISYTTSPGGSPTPSPSPSGSPSQSPTPSPSPSTSPPGGCALAMSVVNGWPGGYQLQLTVTNNGPGTSTAWTAGFSFADSAESIASSWNATVTQSGTRVSAASASYNGAIPSGGTATWGMVVSGGNQTLTGLACTLR